MANCTHHTEKSRMLIELNKRLVLTVQLNQGIAVASTSFNKPALSSGYISLVCRVVPRTEELYSRQKTKLFPVGRWHVSILASFHHRPTEDALPPIGIHFPFGWHHVFIFHYERRKEQTSIRTRHRDVPASHRSWYRCPRPC